MAQTQLMFYATREDLLDVLLPLEEKYGFTYATMGAYVKPEIEVFQSLSQITGLGVSPHGKRYGVKSYLLAMSKAEISVQEKVTSCANRDCFYWLDTSSNPDALALYPSGIFSPTTLLDGRLYAASESGASIALFKLIAKEIKRKFERVKAYWLGRQAAKLLDSGGRLAMDIDTPAEYDLKRM